MIHYSFKIMLSLILITILLIITQIIIPNNIILNILGMIIGLGTVIFGVIVLGKIFKKNKGANNK